MNDGATTDGTTTLSQSRLTSGLGTTTFDSSALASAQSVDGVTAATATLTLSNISFSGAIPDPTAATAPTDGQSPPQGGPDRAGGSSFGVDSFSVMVIHIGGSSSRSTHVR